jgi:hypothetical protein
MEGSPAIGVRIRCGDYRPRCGVSVCRPRTRTGLEREHRIHEEIERQDHVEGDVGADERLIESGDAQSLRLQRH